MSRTAGALVRVSTDDQSLDSQREGIEQWARRERLSIRWYEETATSGAAHLRPVLDQLLRDARKGSIQVVVVAALDRMARDVLRLVMTLDALEAAGVSLVSLREGIDFRGPVGRALAALIGAVAEIERAAIRERVRAGLAAARARGTKLGRPRYRLSPRQRQRLVALRRDGVSLRKIARDGLVTAIDDRGRRRKPSLGFLSRAARDADRGAPSSRSV